MSDPRIVIIGAGFGGIAAAIELQAHGFDDITIVDRAEGPGGTWFYNDYPGAACDVPSHLYSYSFAQRLDWTRLCSPQAEILDYIRGVVRDFGLERRLELAVEVTSIRWDDDGHRWRTTAADGRTWDSEGVIVATGQLHRESYPPIPGIESFEGHSFHSSSWDHDYEMSGRRVAVVGTGASAVQFVPEIASEVGELVVFQRTGNWFMPRKNRRYPGPVRALIARAPGLQAMRRRLLFDRLESLTMMIRHPRSLGRLGRLQSELFMRRQVRDPELRERIWPDYPFGCKRVLFSSQFLPALQRENVELVTDRIEAIEPAGIRTDDGRLHEVDCIIWGTGFRTNDFMFPMEIDGVAGRSLAAEWEGGAHAHLGMAVPGFPSLFLMYGPNTNTSGGSIIFYLEAQAAYIRQALQRVREAGAAAISVKPEVEARSDAEVQARFAGTAWTECDSWYRTEGGRIVANWPGYMREYAELTAELDPAEYDLTPAS